MPVTASVIGAGAGLIQTVIGAIGQGKANKQLKKLFKQRTAYSTPSEIFDVLNSTQYNAQSGYDPQTLDFLTSQADRGFATQTGTALRLGADPNTISGLDDKYLQDIMRIGSDNATLQLQNFDKFLNAKTLVAENKTAEWQSREDLLKDQIQAVAGKAAAGAQNVNSGINTVVQAGSNLAASQLFKPTVTPTTQQNSTGGFTTAQMQQLQSMFGK
jgi:hypothetical protein